MAPEFRKEDYPLHRRGCETWDGHIFVHLGREGGAEVRGRCARNCATCPARFAAWRMADLRLGRRIVYDVKANWKLIVLNFNECLHCPNLHPALNRLHHYLGADNVEPTACYCGGAMGFVTASRR
jgi:Rieske 2Fe-2S family protein